MRHSSGARAAVARAGLLIVLASLLASCGGGLFGERRVDPDRDERRRERAAQQENPATIAEAERRRRGSIFDLFDSRDDPNTTVEVNRYLWNASLDVLNFLPIEAADPFSGVIVTGWGTPPGGGRPYRATIYVQDPALDARSQRVEIVTRAGPAQRDTVRAVEDAILTRARQLRIADGKL
jgi:hypothetical protein